jgi:AAA domain
MALTGATASREVFLKRDLTAPIEAGERNVELTRRAGKLTRVFDSQTAREVLHFINEKYCKNPLQADEVDEITVYENATEEPMEVGLLMSDVEAEKIEWLWPGRIPLGKLTILDGDPSLGKSVITMDLAARVTNGWGFPDGDIDYLDNLDNVDHLDNVGGVVLLSAEDDLSDTIRPRLDAAGADVGKVCSLSTMPDRKGGERTPTIPEDIEIIEQAILKMNAKLLIVDPVMAFLSPKVNANYDQEVRQALTPLKQMAERTGVAVLLIRHLSKQEGRKSLYRGGGSIGIIGAARSALVVEEHPDNKDLKVLAVNKANLAHKADSLTYSIITAENDAARIAWGQSTDLDANDILNPDTSEVGKAKAWLTTELQDMSLPANTVKKDAEEADISETTLYRAKASLGVKSKRVGVEWYWSLEDSQGGQGSQDGQDSQDRQQELMGLAS